MALKNHKNKASNILTKSVETVRRKQNLIIRKVYCQKKLQAKEDNAPSPDQEKP